MRRQICIQMSGYPDYSFDGGVLKGQKRGCIVWRLRAWAAEPGSLDQI